MNASNDKRGVYTLKIDNKDINLLFSMNFWRLLSQEGIEMKDLGQSLSGGDGFIKQLESLSKVIIAAGKSYAIKNKTEFNHDIDEVFEWFEEEVTNIQVTEMTNIMMATKLFGNVINQGVKREASGKPKPSLKK